MNECDRALVFDCSHGPAGCARRTRLRPDAHALGATAWYAAAWVQRWAPVRALVFGCLLSCLAGTCPVRAREAIVQFSDGEMIRGEISLTRGTELKLHTGTGLSSVGLDRVREIRFEPEKEKMEQKWRFVEAGRTRKEKWGASYPVRHIRATLVPADGRAVTGHLYTTVMYVENDEGTSKVILRAKQKGKGGDTFADLVYPVRVRFQQDAHDRVGAVRLKRAQPGRIELAALTHGSLLRLTGRPLEETGEIEIPSALGAGLFLAIRSNGVIRVGWPAQEDPALSRRVREGLESARDFFDGRQLLGVHRADNDVYSLVMLTRKGKTSLDSEKSQPWRLGIWRWRQNEDERLMVAGRGYFFRGITAVAADSPRVLLCPEIWEIELKDGVSLP